MQSNELIIEAEVSRRYVPFLNPQAGLAFDQRGPALGVGLCGRVCVIEETADEAEPLGRLVHQVGGAAGELLWLQDAG